MVRKTSAIVTTAGLAAVDAGVMELAGRSAERELLQSKDHMIWPVFVGDIRKILLAPSSARVRAVAPFL